MEDWENIALELYKNGHNTVTISKIVKKHNSTVGRFLKRNGYSNLGMKKINHNDIERIVNLYNSGLNAREIHEKYYFDILKDYNSIGYIIRKHGTPRTDQKLQNTVINHDYFSEINTETKAYLLGLLLADGNVMESKNNKSKTLQISLKAEDGYLIEILKNEIQPNKKITISERQNKGSQHKVVFYSDKIVEDLSVYGIVPRKSLIIERLPIVKNEDLQRHVLRGMFDGNGTVYSTKNNKLRVAYYGTNKLCKDFQLYLHNILNLPMNKITDQKKTNVSFFGYGKQSDVQKFFHFLYNDSEIKLKRKYELFCKYF